MLKTLILTDLSREICEELEVMRNPACFEVEVVAAELGEYLFNDKFEKEFKAFFDIFNLSEIKFAEFLLSQCIRLCDESEPTHFHFLLVVAFLKVLVINFFHEYQCFRILYISNFCLDVLYDRVFGKVFESKEFYDNFKLFCQEFLKRFPPDTEHREFKDSNDGKYYIDFVEERFNVNSNSFSLNESEVKSFEKHYSLESIAKREWPILSEKKIAEDAYFDVRKYYSSDCETCGSKCFNFLNFMNFL
ncbi:hypothetical protein TNIN_322821 [Trichonephila inaurata madagascariensis]|uniref:Uncharacterized protein n=1 Tax=Trichonephila inaurata madagascariensis TaxID=2747483 RepID=A0A8X6IW18_9ARAC|nr:hypothetical protein TNIN_322821 [Trichonephila inaurata madagascariensis]